MLPHGLHHFALLAYCLGGRQQELPVHRLQVVVASAALFLKRLFFRLVLIDFRLQLRDVIGLICLQLGFRLRLAAREPVCNLLERRRHNGPLQVRVRYRFIVELLDLSL